MGADQPGHREWTMSDTSDRTAYLDLDTKDETFLDATELVLNMGPQHPSTHGVLRVILKLDGEKVLGTECVIGYLHRGVEKIAENRTYAMFNPVRRPHGLRGCGLQRAGLLRGGREAAERGSAAARAVHPRHPDRAVPHRQPPGLAGHARARYRRADAAVLLLPRPRRDPEDLREILRRAADHARVPHRRLHLRGLRRLRAGLQEVLRRLPAQARRVRRAADHQPHLGGAHQGRRHSEAGRLHRAGRDRPGAARQRREVGPAQGAALRVLQEFRFRNSDRTERRHLRPVPGAHRGDAAVGAHHPPGGGWPAGRARSWPRCRR